MSFLSLFLIVAGVLLVIGVGGKMIWGPDWGPQDRGDHYP